MKTLILLSFFLNFQTPVWALLEDEKNTIQIVKDSAPSVVFVTNIAVVRDIFMDSFAVPNGAGSGFVWDSQGHIVTNYHLVQNGSTFLVTLKDGTQLQAKVVGVEPRKDIAVLKIVKGYENLKPIKLGRFDQIQVGQKAVAIGSPLGLDSTVTVGIVSAMERQVQGIGGVTIHDMIQTDAAINPGNSGGPLLNSDNELIGMNTLIYSNTGMSSGIGFAVPVSYIRRIVPQLIKYGKVTQPGIGISILSEQQKYYLFGDIEGVVIKDVNPGSPASEAGLTGVRGSQGGRITLGDVIIGIEDKKVRDYDELYNALDSHKVGDTVKVKVMRRGRSKTIPIRLIGI